MAWSLSVGLAWPLSVAHVTFLSLFHVFAENAPLNLPQLILFLLCLFKATIHRRLQSDGRPR